MVLKRRKKKLCFLLTFSILLSLFLIDAYATRVEALDGQISITDTKDNNKISEGIVTIQARGSLFSKETNTVTITNETANKAELKFYYAASSYNSFKVAGKSVAASGTYSAVLEAGASVTVELQSKSGLSDTTATLTLSNFGLTTAAAASNVTIHFDSNLGGVTAGGTTVTDGTTQEVFLDDGVALVATPNSGTTFLGWIDGAGTIFSTATSYTLRPANDMEVEAVFVGANSAPYFGVGSMTQHSESVGLLGLSKLYYHTVAYDQIFDNLTDAAAAAASSSAKNAIVLLNSGTLPAGDYTIPAGETLLIPFDSANTLYTTEAQSVKPTSDAGDTLPLNVTKYRTLTMADGANLNINGAMSLSAKHRYAAGGRPDGGSPTDNVSFVEMEEGSTITVNNGGALYAYGYITGEGTVTAKSGATVYENFQFMDFRGGTQSTKMKNGVFPLSQYYVQNIEVPLTLEYGSKEYAYSTIYMSSAKFGTSIQFIGPSNCMFNLTKGKVVKYYDGSRDRLNIELDGTMDLSSVDMYFGTSSINSEDYDLPINSNITVYVQSDSAVTISQDIALLPGAEVIVQEGATCTLGSRTNIYVYDADQWGGYCTAGAAKMYALRYAPGRTYNRTEKDLIDAKILVNGTFDASEGYLYTTSGGANICSTDSGVVKINPGTQTVTHQFTQSTSTYTEIPITSAKLKNENESYVDTTSAAYNYDHHNYCCGTANCAEQHGVWYAGEHTYKDSEECSCGGHAAVKIIPKSGNERFFSSLAAACKAFTTEDLYIQMLTGTTEPGFTIDKNIYLDLNGQDVEISEGKLTISDGYTLYGMDTATNGFTSNAAGQYGEIIGTVSGTVAPNYRYDRTKDVSSKCYVASTTDNKLSFHRFDMGVTDYTFYGSGNTGEMVFNMVFKGDALAKAEILKRGVEFNSFYDWSSESEDTLTGRITNITGSEFTIAYTVKAAVMLCDADNTVFTGNKYFANGISFQSAMKAVYAELTDEAKKDAFEKFATANSFSLSN